MKLQKLRKLLLSSGLLAITLTSCDLFYKEDKINGPLNDDYSWSQALLLNDINNFTLSAVIPPLNSHGDRTMVKIAVTKNKCYRLIGDNEDYLEFKGDNCYQYVHDEDGWHKQEYYASDSDYNKMIFDIRQDWFSYFSHVYDDRLFFQYEASYRVYHAEGFDFEIDRLETTDKYYSASFKIYVNRNGEINTINETFYVKEEPTKESEGHLQLNQIGTTDLELPKVE